MDFSELESNLMKTGNTSYGTPNSKNQSNKLKEKINATIDLNSTNDKVFDAFMAQKATESGLPVEKNDVSSFGEVQMRAYPLPSNQKINSETNETEDDLV